MTITTIQRLPYPDLQLILRESGGGQPVFLVHGAGGPDTVTGFIEHFAGSHHVLAPTHPGWDGTPRPEWFTGIDSLVETYLDLLDDLDLRDVVLIGSSLGGWIAAEMAVRDRGDRIARLVLLGSVGPRIEGHQAPGLGRGGPPAIPGQDRPGPPAGLMQTLSAYVGSSMDDPKLLHRLRRVTIPSLLVWGENDHVVPVDFGRAYAQALPNASFEVIPSAGHLPANDAPEQTLVTIDTFLAEQSLSAATGGDA